MDKLQIDKSTQIIKNALGWSDADLIEQSLGLKKNTAANPDLKGYPLWAVTDLLDKLNISFENFATAQIDPLALREQYYNNKAYLPARYQTYQGSRVKTLNNMLKPLPKVWKKTILNRLQLSMSTLQDPEGKICGLALIDTFIEIKKLGANNKFFKFLGFNCSQHYKNVLLSQDLTSNSSAKTIYETTLNNLSHKIEKNLEYKITSLSSDALLMTISTRQELQDTLKIKNFGSPEHCQNIWGWNMGLLNLTKGKLAEVKKLSCAHHGDKSCKYEIHYGHAH